MGNILRFPDRCDTVSCREFLQDGDDTLQFETSGESKQGQEYTFPLPKSFVSTVPHKLTTKDWSNQELAHLYRVKRLLDLAGVSNSIDRGLSDEGDPWFVFCDATNEVFIHLCRIDGLYFLDNPSIERPLRGKDFTQLVDAFLQRKLREKEEYSKKSKHRLVQFERNGKVFLHPATMLAALVWTLLLESDDLVMVLSEGAETFDDQDDILAPAFSASGHAASLELHNLWQASLGLEEGNSRSTTDHTLVSQYLRDVGFASDYKFGPNAYIIGLSAIAISLGIMSERSPAAIDEVTAESILELLNTIDSQTAQSIDTLSNFALGTDKSLGILAALEDLFVDAAMSSREPPEKHSSVEHISANVLPQNADLMGSDETPAEMEVSVREASSKAFAFVEKVETQAGYFKENNTDQALTFDVVSKSQKMPVYTDVVQVSLMLSKLENFEKGALFSAMSLRSYTIDSNTLYATFDISDAEFDKTSDLLSRSASKGYESKDDPFQRSEVSSLVVSSQVHQNNTEEAYRFVSYLLDKEGNLEIIALDKELIFVDPDVFGVGSTDTYVMSWKMDDGETISVIGLNSNYADFALTA